MEASYYVPGLFIAPGARPGVDNAYRELDEIYTSGITSLSQVGCKAAVTR